MATLLTKAQDVALRRGVQGASILVDRGQDGGCEEGEQGIDSVFPV